MAEPTPAPPPKWLTRLVEAIPTVRPEDFSRRLPVTGSERPSAVLLLFGAGPSGPDVLLIQRASTMRNHAGQPAFPGGSAEPPDAGPADTALREAAEETGLDRSGVRVLGELPQLAIPVSGFAVTPVVAWWERPSPVRVVDPAEVAAVSRVPVAELVDPANRVQVRHPASGYVGPAFAVRGMLVWGFTAILLDHVLAIGGWERPWRPGRLQELPS